MSDKSIYSRAVGRLLKLATANSDIAKKNAARFAAPALPKSFRPRGSGSDAATCAVVDRHPRFRLARAIAQTLPRYPCCGSPPHRRV